MFQVIIPHNQQGQAAIKFETEDRAVARAAALIGKALKVEVKVTQAVAERSVKFRGL